MDIQPIISRVKHFVSKREDVLALALCGSYARGAAGPHSDIDLLFLVSSKVLLKNSEWLQELNLHGMDDAIISHRDVTYGNVWSRHVSLRSGSKIEFTFAEQCWAATDPTDPGTIKVVRDGFQILYDPHHLLEQLLKKVLLN
ncbi:nucleotidyltransferase domain-containing protein [Robiginitalea sp. IMCC43444]|uniref:nucleotidyltransferase domain-containing protein n=1 Tax=Robiginitalea sp. IMCC43444 TaxID=3459121 RepID=UPI0040428E14